MQLKKFSLLLVFVVFNAFLFVGCNESEERSYDTIAEIENVGPVTFTELQKYYQDYLYYLRYPENKTEGYKTALNEVIVEKRKAAEFIDLEMYQDSSLMEPVQRSVNEELTLKYFNENFLSQYINDESIQEYYEEMDREVEYRQIFIPRPTDPVPGQIEAIRDSLKYIVSRLSAGEPFVDLANVYSQDEESLARGGEMPPVNWENVSQKGIFTNIFNLNVGEIRALQTQRAFYVVEVTDVRKAELPPLEEVRNMITNNLREVYLDRALENFTAMKKSLLDSSAFEWNDEALNELTKWAKQDNFYNNRYKSVLTEAIESGNNKTLVSFEGGMVDYKKYLSLLINVLIPGKDSNVSKKDHIKFIDDAIRSEIIVEKAREEGLDKQILTENATNILKFHYKRMYTQEKVRKNLPEPTEENLQTFYEEHKDSLLYQFAKVNVYIKPFNTEEEALALMDRVESGTSFTEATNRRYKVRTFMINAEGEMVYFNAYENTEIGEMAFDLEEGAIEGPVEFKESEDATAQPAVMFIARKLEAKELAYEEIEDIEKKFEDFHTEEKEQEVRKKLKTKYPAVIYEDALNERINNTGDAN